MVTNRIIFILSLIGAVISGYLLFTYLTVSPIICLNSGCEIVRASSYSRLFGIPLPAFGGLFYLLVLLISFFRTTGGEDFLKRTTKIILFFSFAGLLFSAYLTFLEAFVIKAYCIWCLSSAFVVVLLFFTSLYEFRRLK